jgi:hypothetical protein
MHPIIVMTDLETKTLAVYKINQALLGISGSIALLKKLKDAEAEQVTLLAGLVVAQEAMAVAQAEDNAAKQAELYSRFAKVEISASNLMAQRWALAIVSRTRLKSMTDDRLT